MGRAKSTADLEEPASAKHRKALMEALTNAMPKSMNKPEILIDGMQKIWGEVTYHDRYGNLFVNDAKFRKEVAWLRARKSRHRHYEAISKDVDEQESSPRAAAKLHAFGHSPKSVPGSVAKKNHNNVRSLAGFEMRESPRSSPRQRPEANT